MKLSGSILPPDRVLLFLIVSIQDTKIQVTAGLIIGPITMISVEDTVYDQVRKSEEQRGYPPRMFLEFVSPEERVEYKARIGKGALGSNGGRCHRTRIWRIGLA